MRRGPAIGAAALRRAALGAAAVAAALGLGGCATPAAPRPALVVPAAGEAVSAGVPDAALQRFATTQLVRARRAEDQGRLAEASLAYEVLALVRPDGGHPVKAAELAQRIDAAVGDRWSRAQAAQRRGELDLAAQLYLEVLAFAPQHAAAAEALRGVERERNRRHFVGKFSRQTLTRRAAADAEMTGDDGNGTPNAARNQLEHATLLARQGDLDAAIALLRSDAARPGADPALKALLVDLHVQRAEGLLTKDTPAARTSVNAALALDPEHAAARALSRRMPAEKKSAR